MPDIWQDVPDSKTITIKQNVRFHVRICSGNVQLKQTQNLKWPIIGHKIKII